MGDLHPWLYVKITKGTLKMYKFREGKFPPGHLNKNLLAVGLKSPQIYARTFLQSQSSLVCGVELGITALYIIF